MTDVIGSNGKAGPYVDVDPKSLKFSFYKKRPDKVVKLKGGELYVMTKKNKGTVIGVYSTTDKSIAARDELGGERYYRISRFIIDDDVYK